MTRLLIVAALFGTVMNGEDINLPLDDGNILIHAQFIRDDGFGSNVPELALKLKNQTTSSWRTLKLQFDIGGLCKGEPQQWTVPVVTDLGWTGDHELVKEYTDTVISLVGKADGCKAEIIRASLVLAENSRLRIDGTTGQRVDLQKQLQELKEEREAEASVQAETERKAAEARAEAKAKTDAAEAARRKREEAEAALERRKARAACRAIYRSTIDKKVNELTVREDQQVRACQALDMYPPQ